MVLVGVLLLVYLLTQWLGTAAGAGCAWVPRSVSPRKLFGEFPHPRRVAARAVRTWKAGLLYVCSRIFQPLFWCMGVACGVQRIPSRLSKCPRFFLRRPFSRGFA